MLRTGERSQEVILQGRGTQFSVYRTGLVLQALGALLLATLYPLRSPYYTGGIMLFELGTLLSALVLKVRIRWIKLCIQAAIALGLPLQAYGMLAAPPGSAGTYVLAGVTLVCAGAGGMAAKEAYCFAFREGWALLVLLPGIAIVNLVGRERTVLNTIGFSALFLLLLSLAGKKLRQPAGAVDCSSGPSAT